ncbi:DNA repair protein RecN [Gemelliphila palaticanis]|uniref:DNA repair protein RecN n=1 Tax=Gemelliphila palaticanis TaxID=81950 RepID=A0ABX2T0Q3_9BACL|nr:DNA repair protein RecN [Gemella palaticanis]MBF0715288.1 DNA repair protein RecN [Gemella palaticanis]NYS47218.1 DNA repair protein RecN [Gemella palaticanis]
MLIQLNIKQFGIIENSIIDFKNGLTILSGETGSGKSMIFSAISQLSGQRSSTSYIRHGQDKATIEGIFDLPNNNKLIKLLDKLDIDYEDGILVIRRDIYISGKSICRVNNLVVNLTTLKEISSFLIDIHEQHDSQILLNEKNHISLLDSYAKESISSLLLEYKNKYREYKSISNKIEHFKNKESDILQKLDFLKYQYEEINKLNLVENEDIELNEELEYLSNYEKINNIIQETSNIISSDEGVLSGLYSIKENVKDLAKYSSNFEEKSEDLENLYYILEDLQYDLSRYSSSIEYDENRLNNIEYRLSKIKQLEKKYSKTVNELIKYKTEINNEIFELENYDENYEKYKEEKLIIEDNLKELARKITLTRKDVARKLEELIHKELKFLYMEKSIIKIQIKEKELSADGVDDVKILISSNLGEPLKSLSKVASGGELSRVMLALKIIFSNSIDAISIIFDEIDTGISGRVSQKMAEKIYQLSINSQVLCISHLPQTTALADNNLLISKEIRDDRTISTIRELGENEVIQEIARMISGNTTTQLSVDHAIELVNNSKIIKNNIKFDKKENND